MTYTTNIVNLPTEILEFIFTFLHPDLESIVKLSSVCTKFRKAANGVPITIHIPLQEKQLKIVSSRRIPILTICNQEPALFVNYQILQLNMCRLHSAQLVSNDYLPRSNKCELSSHYVELLNHVLQVARCNLSHLMINADLVSSDPICRPNLFGIPVDDRVHEGLPRCASLISRCRNLRFLSLHFTPQIELQQRIVGGNCMQKFLDEILSKLTRLRSLYIFVCPAQKLNLSSESLEKFCIYKSEFVQLQSLLMPKLKILIVYGNMTELFFKAHQGENGQIRGRKLLLNLFEVIHDGCPSVETFNSVDLSWLKQHQLTKRQWSYYALKLCVKQYRRTLGAAGLQQVIDVG